MRKMSAHGRRLARSGRGNELDKAEKTLHGMQILKAISIRRDRDAPPLPGGEYWGSISQETARDSELRVRAALDSLLTGVKPIDPEEDLANLNAALAIGGERMFQILFGDRQPADHEMIDIGRLPAGGRAALQVFIDARQALNRAHDRWRQHRQWGMDGPGRGALAAGVNLFADLMNSSTPAQMDAAYRQADRLVRKLHGKGLIR